MGLKLVGECNRCGQCCKEAWRFNYRGTRYIDCDGKEQLTIESQYHDPKIDDAVPEDKRVPCSELIFDENGASVCKHQDDKPLVCSRWPFFPSDLIFPGCGFSFVEEDENAGKND